MNNNHNVYFFVTSPNQFFKNLSYRMLVLILLVFFTKALPWYSLYQLIFNLNMFFYQNIEYLFDTIITDVLYPLDIVREYRLYYEHIDHKSVFAPYSTKPEGYLLENDEYLIIRNYIRQRLLS